MSNTTEWEKYAELVLSLHSHIEVIPQTFRAVRWYLLKNEVTGDFTRLNACAFKLISRLDGKQTLDQHILKLNKSVSDEEQLELADTITLVRSLVASDYLKLDTPANATQQAAITKYRNRKKLTAWISNPLSIKLSILDPDKFLDRFRNPMTAFFTRSSLVIWLAMVMFGIYIAVSNNAAISAALNSNFFRPENLVSMTLVFIVIKLIHELAHAFAVKNWGGNVNEMGITFLVFSPVPYVDASSAWAFQDKYKRVVVCAMGIIAELLIASLSIIVWSLSEPGLVKATALNSAIIASVSTLAFNANPLLKFDGYYMMQDLIEIPNLYQRSKNYLTYLITKHVVGLKNGESPVYAKGEQAWLLGYGILAFLYRLIILSVIIVFLINELLIVGLLISAWAVISQVLRPTFKALTYLFRSPDIQPHRGQSLLKSSLVLTSVVCLMCFVPFPNTTFAKGTVWVDQQAEIYSSQDGFISEIMVESGAHVAAGTELLKLSAPTLDARIQKMEASKRELSVKSQTEFVTSGGKSSLNREQLVSLDYELEQLYDDKASLIIKAKVAGRFFSSDIAMKTGKHLKRGEFIGYVFSSDNLIVQAVFTQSDIGSIRENTKTIEVRFAEDASRQVSARIQRETPASSPDLPSKALGASGGGDIIVKTQQNANPVAKDEHFQIDFSLQEPNDILRIGGIVFIRIEHAASPIAIQVSKVLKRVVMTKIDI